MPSSDSPNPVRIHQVDARSRREAREIQLPGYDRERFEDVAFLTSMGLVLLGNYAQTGHFGGPLAYTPMNVAVHLGGPEMGGLRYDLRRPKHPLADRFMLAGGHSIPTCYSLWIVMYEALLRQREATGSDEYAFDPKVGMLGIDALGFRRSAGALKTLLSENGLDDHPLFSQAKLRGIRSLAGHSETTDVTNDVNGGPSGIGVSTSGGKAMFYDAFGSDPACKVIALEGEFAMTEGHAQELKTAALAQRVGKRLRILLSMNNAGIDDTLLGGVVGSEFDGYDLPAQWASYGWSVLTIDNGHAFDDLFAALTAMERSDPDDRRPRIVVANTTKGWWPAAVDGQIPGYGEQIVSYPSHPYSHKMNSPYFLALAGSFEERFGVEFVGVRDGVPATEADRLVQFKTNVDVLLSALEKKEGLGAWIADRVVETAGKLTGKTTVRFDAKRDPFQDDRLRVANLPQDPTEISLPHPVTGEEVTETVKLFEPAGAKRGTRRAISEIGKWLNYVTEGRFFTISADLSGSINLEKANLFGHYDPVSNPAGTRLKAGIQEAVNAATLCGLLSQNASEDPAAFAGAWGVSGTYGAFTPLMYTPARVYSQQNQDSPFRIGVLTILAGHSGPETAADARTHFGIFAPQVWTLFPRGQVVNLYFWDYNDVAPGYFAAAERAARDPEVGILVIHVARPDSGVADRNRFADTDPTAAAKGIYLIRDYHEDQPKQGTVFVQGASSTVNLVTVLDRLESEGVNVRIASVISPELFAWQPEEYRERVYPFASRFDAMVVSTMTKRVPPLPDLGPLTEEYSLYADLNDRWLSGGTEADVIAEAQLDPDSIFEAVVRFARDRDSRMARQRAVFE